MLGWFTKVGLLLAAFIAAATPGVVKAQNAEAVPAETFVVIPLSFVKQDDLDFGSIVPSSTNGTVVMDSTGAVTTTGGVIQIDGTQQPARFWGYGQFNQRVLINVNANSYTLRRDGGSETMIMDQVLIGSQPPIIINTNPRRFRIANPDGYFSFTMAGRLRVNANQQPGVYTGTFIVTLEYE